MADRSPGPGLERRPRAHPSRGDRRVRRRRRRARAERRLAPRRDRKGEVASDLPGAVGLAAKDIEAGFLDHLDHPAILAGDRQGPDQPDGGQVAGDEDLLQIKTVAIGFIGIPERARQQIADRVVIPLWLSLVGRDQIAREQVAHAIGIARIERLRPVVEGSVDVIARPRRRWRAQRHGEDGRDPKAATLFGYHLHTTVTRRGPAQSAVAATRALRGSVTRTKRSIKTAASPNGSQQNRKTTVTARPTASGSVASPRPAMLATTPAMAAPKAVPIERTEVSAAAVLRCSPGAALSIARATRWTL